jgi:nitrogen regulatory protein P-II 1
LAEIGIFGMTITEVSGRGKQRGISLQWRAGEYRVEFLPKVKIETVVLDEEVGKTLNAIIRKAKTGERGDGKIFVFPIDTAVRVRNGDEGENAI